jgi:hypothetical protein
VGALGSTTGDAACGRISQPVAIVNVVVVMMLVVMFGSLEATRPQGAVAVPKGSGKHASAGIAGKQRQTGEFGPLS